MKSLYIDDVREIPVGYTHYARTFDDARQMLQYEDWDQISFDYDLGIPPQNNGYELMKLLKELVVAGVRKAPQISVHTFFGGDIKYHMYKLRDEIEAYREKSTE